MRLVTRIASVGVVVGVLIGMNGQDSLAWRPYDRDLQKKVANDPLVKKYVKVSDSGCSGTNSNVRISRTGQ